MSDGEPSAAELSQENERLRRRVDELEARAQRLQTTLHSAKRAARDALRVSEARYADLYENAPDMYLSVDAATGRVLQCNQTMLSATGYAREEVVGRPVVEFYAPECLDDSRRALATFLRTGEVADVELVVLCKDGRRLDVSLNVTASRDETGRIVRSRSSWRDITEKRRLRDQLVDREADFQLLFETMPIGWAEHHMIYDEEGAPADYVFLRVNQAFERFTGLQRESILNRRVTEVIPGIRDAEPDLVQVYGEITRSGAQRREEIYFAPFDRWYSLTAFRRREGCFVVMFEEITERKKAEMELAASREELERSNKELEQFAYVASHDLQEPLRMVASYTQLLAESYAGRLGDEADKYIGYAVAGAKRMQGLINDLLAYSRVGKRRDQVVLTDCNEVVAEVLRNLEVAIKESDAEIIVGALPRIMGDPVQIGQVFQNLVSNSIKFRGVDAPRIEITAERRGATWDISVSDNGIGIEPRFHERIFVVFQRLHERSKYKGSGIGLAIVAKILELHGGSVRVDSVVGEGSRFTVSLPVADSE